MKTLYILLLLPVIAMAQHDRIWYFGYEAGLHFSGGAPVALTNGKLVTQEGCASIADHNGDLLFYTNGISVLNKNHGIMENGQGLMGHTSSSQSALIVPKPGSTTVYYIFTVTAVGEAQGFRYSVVDMEGGNGLGAVVEKNILLHTPSCEKLTATWHANGEDIWVVGHHNGDNIFLSYRVTANGVNPDPVATAVGNVIGLPNNDGSGCMKISPSGERLAVANGYEGTQLFDFDPATGIVSNPVTLSNAWETIGGVTVKWYGVEFSPSNDILYTNDMYRIKQYDLTAPDIAVSAIEVYAITPDILRIGAMQNGPDGKLYVAQYQSHKLSVINNPDVVGAGCSAVANAIDLGGGWKFCYFGLPNFLPATFRVSFQAQQACEGSEVTFSASSSGGIPETIHWDFGDGSFSTAATAFYTYAAAGTYTVKLTALRQGITRIAEQQVVIVAPPVAHTPDDIRLCDAMGDGTAVFSLSANESQILAGQPNTGLVVTYHLSEAFAEAGSGALNDSFTNTANPQVLYARVTDTLTGCHSVTFFSLIVEELVIVMPDSFPICEGVTGIITAPEGFDSYQWSNGAHTRSIEVSQAGTYTLTVFKDSNGMQCSALKDISVTGTDTPVITNVDVQDWSIDQNRITVNTRERDYQYSIDGVHFQQGNTFEGLVPGFYTVYVQNACGTAFKEVALLMYPKFFTPNGDGEHETWAIRYSWLEPGMTVHIYDRYGKRLSSFKGNSSGWDGRYNGRDLPATDYWFVVERQDGRQYKGHFAMLR